MRPADRPWASHPRSPPTSAATLELWCGATNGGRVINGVSPTAGQPPSGSRSPPTTRCPTATATARKTLRQHCFADTRWTSQHEVMRPGGGHLDGEPCLGLAHHIGEVRRRLGGGVGRGDPPGQAGGPA